MPHTGRSRFMAELCFQKIPHTTNTKFSLKRVYDYTPSKHADL